MCQRLYEGKPLPVITAQLGHSSTAVTDRYLAKIGPADLVSQVRDRYRLHDLSGEPKR